MTTAIGKPGATSTITTVTDQDGRFSAGSTTEAISITIQPATAYSTGTRITRLRLRPAKKPSPASTSDPPPIIKPPCGKGRRLVVRPFSERYSSHRSEEHTSELQSLMRISYAVFCLKKKKKT